MTAGSPKVMITSGEASGDRLGAGLARALLRRRPDLLASARLDAEDEALLEELRRGEDQSGR